MRDPKFRAPTCVKRIAKVKRELGPTAVIVSTRERAPRRARQRGRGDAAVGRLGVTERRRPTARAVDPRRRRSPGSRAVPASSGLAETDVERIIAAARAPSCARCAR